tara:strand:+ start:4132 stop:4626 length:495 start_codon:yes stop_codon:yes gene_type:complete
MATKDSNIKGDIRFLNFLWPFTKWSNENKINKSVYDELISAGEIQIETLYENTLAYQSNGKFIKESGDGRDFSDGSDAKKSTVRWRNKRNHYDAPVTGILNKIGDLRVLVYEWNLDKFYFFKIPHSIYTGMKYIEIPFDKETYEPKRKNKWWGYEVPSFEELCK